MVSCLQSFPLLLTKPSKAFASPWGVQTPCCLQAPLIWSCTPLVLLCSPSFPKLHWLSSATYADQEGSRASELLQARFRWLRAYSMSKRLVSFTFLILVLLSPPQRSFSWPSCLSPVILPCFCIIFLISVLFPCYFCNLFTICCIFLLYDEVLEKRALVSFVHHYSECT